MNEDASPEGPGAKSDWDNRISLRSDTSGAVGYPDLPPPAGLRATAGVGQVTLDWLPVDGAVGYLIHRATLDGEYAPVDHHGRDVLSVPRPPYADSTVEVGVNYRYTVSSVPEVTTHGRPGEPVHGTAQPSAPVRPRLQAVVDAGSPGTALAKPWVPMIGSERLSQLLSTDLSGGRPIGAELRRALQRMHDEIGVRTVRAHAIFHDDTKVYTEVDGKPVYDFSVVDRIYDAVLAIGLRPVVEVGFMPRDLAADPTRTVFEYGAIISPPKDYAAWSELVRRFTQHLVDTYGREEVVGWDFEVWNEANLEVFWSGSKAEWMRLYDATAVAIKSVDPRIPVGGPSSAAAGWVDDLLAHCRESGSPVDFVSTHTYGSPPLDVRASLERHGFPDARILWTEWGVTPTHFNPVNDTVFAGIFLIHGMFSAAGRIDALSYWVASDHFEELGRPPRLLHGGFGLQTVGGLAKPRYHAMTLLAALGDTELPVDLTGDGAGSLIQCWASRRADGSVAVLIWNLSLDQNTAAGNPLLDRDVALTVGGLAEGTWRWRHTELSVGNGDLLATAAEIGLGDWPADGATWDRLREESALPVAEGNWSTGHGEVTLPLQLLMPSAVLVELHRDEKPTGGTGDGAAER